MLNAVKIVVKMVVLLWCNPPKKNPGSSPATEQEFIIPSGIEKVKPQTLRKQPRDMWLVNEGWKCNRRITVFIFLIFITKLNIYHLFSIKYVLASTHTIVPKNGKFLFFDYVLGPWCIWLEEESQGHHCWWSWTQTDRSSTKIFTV